MSVIGSNILAGASGGAGAGGYEIERSLRFNSGDSAKLTRTPSSAGNRKTWTWSGWVKRSSSGWLLAIGNDKEAIYFKAEGNLVSSRYDGGFQYYVETTPVFNDYSAWYHIVVAHDTTLTTASDRVKIYINGTRITEFNSGTSYPSQNAEFEVNDTTVHEVGKYFNGYLADVHFIDGQALTPTDFGETDDNGVWRPKEFAGTYGWFDNSQTWSTVASITTGSAYSGRGLDKLFNGVINNNDPPSTAFLEQGSSGLVVTFSSAITATSSIKMWIGSYSGYTTGELYVNGSNFDVSNVVGNNTAPVLVDLGVTSLTSFGIRGNQNIRFSGLVVDGKLLIDSGVSVADNSFHLPFTDNSSNAALGTDSSGNSNTWTVNNLQAAGSSWNQSQTWSNGKDGDRSDYPVTNVFDASLTTVGYGAVNQTITVTLPGGSIALTSLRVRADRAGTATGKFYVNGNDYTSQIASGTNWNTITGETSITSIGYGSDTGSNFVGLYAVEVNGIQLVDSGIADPLASGIDSLVDSPSNGTQTDTGAGGEVVGNYCTYNPIHHPPWNYANPPLSNGNLDVGPNTTGGTAIGTFPMSSGKWYWEITVSTLGNARIGAQSVSASGEQPGHMANSASYLSNGQVYNNGSLQGTYASMSAGDVIGLALDMDNFTLKFYKNNTLIVALSSNISGTWVPADTDWNAGGCVLKANFGQRAFAHTAPSGYKSLNTASLPEPTIADGSQYFDTKLYTSNSSSLSVTGYEFSPSFVWIKNRSSAQMHGLFDVVRGANQFLSSNRANAEHTTSGSGYGTGTFNSFDSNGFTLGDDIGQNSTNYPSNEAHVAWAWDAGANSDKTYTVTVSGGNFYIDGAQQPTLTLAEGSTYKFDQADSTNATHPLRFSTTSDGTHGGGSEYTTGVTTAGTPGSAGAYTQIVIAASAPTLYAYCTNHSGMGFQVNTSDTEGSTIVAGGLNSSLYTQNSVYSGGTVTGNTYSGYGWANAFDADFSNAAAGNGATNTTTIDLSSFSITASAGEIILVFNSDVSSNTYWRFNGVTPTASNTSVRSTDSGYEFTLTQATSLTGITLDGLSQLTGVFVAGKRLIDSNVSITTPSIASTVRANPSAGFSIVSVTEDAHADGGTVGHGLNAKPAMIWEKRRDATAGWYVQHSGLGDMSGSYLVLNDTAAKATDNTWNLAEPTASVMSIDPGYLNGNTNADVIYYCFAPVEGYSAMGSFEANTDPDGPFIYTGFRPRFLLIKNADDTTYASNYSWVMIDTERYPNNTAAGSLNPLYANRSAEENLYGPGSGAAADLSLDILSNGFKPRCANAELNVGNTYIYYAVAEHPFASNGGLAR